MRGSDLIIHAGDVGEPALLERLGVIAGVVAVRGNIDKAAWATRLQTTAVVEAGPAILCVLHDMHDLDLEPAIAEFNIVVSGRSHKPGKDLRGPGGRSEGAAGAVSVGTLISHGLQADSGSTSR